MRMGRNGCVWTPMGEQGPIHMGRCKNNANREKIGYTVYVLWMDGRGNFPGHHVLGGLTKSVKNG